MRSRSIFAVSIAFATCALFCPNVASARTSNQSAASADFMQKVPGATAQREADQMVPAEAVLVRAIDAKKMQRGQQIEAKLTDTVHLKNGVDLPKGTSLVGKVATDSMGVDGRSTLALQFTKADLKDGKVVPVDATIIGVAPPEYGAAWDGSASQAPPSAWNGKTLQVDEIGVISGVDLHSRIGGRDSAVFVSSKKDNMKFSNQSQLSLAIAPRGTSGQMSGGA